METDVTKELDPEVDYTQPVLVVLGNIADVVQASKITFQREDMAGNPGTIIIIAPPTI